jgi:hypothetical protein
MFARFAMGALLLALFANSVTAQRKGLYDLDTVREIRLYFKQTNYWTLLKNNYASKTNMEADMKVDGVTYPRIGIRFRGNTSYRRLPSGSQKAGFNIETDFYIPGQDLYGYEHMNLNNGFHDPTFTREVITYQLARKYMCAPKANFVKVYLNDAYWGIYINVQQPNSDMMKEWFRSSGGNRYRGFPSGGSGGFNNSAYNYLGNVPSGYKIGWEFKKGDGTDLMNMITILTKTPSSGLLAALPKVWSIDQSYWYCALMNALAHTDSYIGTGKDHMNYHDPVHDLFLMYPFDVNEAIGGQGGRATLSPYSNTTNPLRPVLSRTLPLGDLRQRYEAHYRTILNETLNWTVIGGLVTKYQAMIAKDVAADTKKIYPTSAFTSNVTRNYGSGPSRILGMKPLVESRERYLKTFGSLTATQAKLSNLTRSPNDPKPTETVTITVKETGANRVALYYRVIGQFIETPMYDDGNHGDGSANDGTWGAFIAAQSAGKRVDYYVGAKTTVGVMNFLPVNAEFQSPYYWVQHPTGTSPIVINEALAKNDTVIKDNNGDYDDCIELYNSSNATVQVSGMYLTDKYDDPTKWLIPTNQYIAAGGSLLIWCDEEGTQGPLHANFKLSSLGELVLLFDKDGKTLVGSLQFGVQVNDISMGRLYDKLATPHVTFMKPSMSALNYTGLGGTRTYSALDSTAHSMSMNLGGIPKVGTVASIDVTGGPASAPCLVIASVGGAYLPFIDGVVLLTVGAPVQFMLATNSSGNASVSGTVPNTPGLPPIYFQALSVSGGKLVGSNALEIIIYK